MRFTRDILKKLSLRPLALALASLLALPASAQTFLQPKLIPTGNWPAAIYSADVNGDGYPDLIYIDQGATSVASTTHVMLNDGHGNFTQSAVIATAGNSLAIADLDGDGRLDIGWAAAAAAPSTYYASQINGYIASGIGGGQFATAKLWGSVAVTGTAVSVPAFVTPVQFQNTGNPYLLVEDLANQVIAFVTDRTPHGTTLLTESLSNGPGPILVANLTSTTHQNYAVLGSNNSLDFFFPNGTGNNGPSPGGYAYDHYTGTGKIASALIQDVNLDGRPDLIAEGANGHIDVFFGNGDGTFQTTSSGGTGPLDGLTGNGGHLIATGDFNHDGKLDALTATPAGVSALLGQGTQYLGLKGIYNAGPGPSSGHSSYALADFNNDGNPDLALDSPEGIAILYGNSDGSFQTSRAFAAGLPAMSGALGKFTSSGNLDAVVSTGATQAQLLRGNGDGTFTVNASSGVPVPTTTSAGPPGLYSTVLAFDANQDGKLDIAIGADGPPAAIPSNTTGLIVQYGDGTGGFSAPTNLTSSFQLNCAHPEGPFFAAPILGDFNGDGAPDLATRNFNYVEGLYSDSQHFGSAGQGSDNPAFCDNYYHDLLASGDFNRDGLDDLIYQTDGHLQILLSSPYSNWNVALSADLSVDGSATTPGQRTAPALSPFNGPAIATSAGGLGFPAAIGSIAVADLDGDGNKDLIVAYANLSANLQAPSAAAPNYLYLWYGSGSGKFLTSAKHPVNPVVLTPSRNFYQIATADMNGDGVPDLILSDGYVVSIQLGNGDGTFGVETHYLAGQGINTISVGDLRNLGHNDLILANGGAVLTNPVANLDHLATNPDVNTGGVTVLLNLSTPLLIPIAAVSASPDLSSFGNSFSILATFATGSQPAPTGTVTFSVDGVVVGTATISGTASPGVLYAAPNTLAIGAHTFTASYSGDSNYQATTFAGTHTVTAASTTNSVITIPQPSTYGASFTITATASGPGTFVFSVDGAAVGTVPSSTNTASVVAPGTYAVAIHTLTVQWFAVNSAIGQIITGTHQVVINPTSLSLLLCVDNPGSLFPCGNPIGNTPLLSPITFFYGQTLDGVAAESSTNLTGNIIFYDGAHVFCTISANLMGGANTCPPDSGEFHAGSRTVYATYTGDANNLPSTSNSIAVNVFPDPTTAKLTSSLNAAVVGSSVTFTAVLAGNYATPIGTVNFYDGTTLLGGGSLDPSGTAAFTTSTLALGSHPITVVYAGTADFNPITSAILTEVITAVVVPPPPGTGFTLTVTPDPASIGAGATGALLVTIAPQANAYPPAIALTCSGLPEETTCNFVTPTIPAGGGATTLQLHVSAPHDCGTTTPYFVGSSDGPASPVPYTFAAVFFGVFAIYKRRRKTRNIVSLTKPESLYLSLGMILIALASLASLSGCGHCTDLGTRPGNYTFTVSASPQSTSTTAAQSVIIPLTVTIP